MMMMMMVLMVLFEIGKQGRGRSGGCRTRKAERLQGLVVEEIRSGKVGWEVDASEASSQSAK